MEALKLDGLNGRTKAQNGSLSNKRQNGSENEEGEGESIQDLVKRIYIDQNFLEADMSIQQELSRMP
jgi:hypothetical protein